MDRVLSPYELNQLKRHGHSVEDLDSYGEMPVEYITGHAEFRGLDFLVDSSTLIPRLESEKIIDLALQFIAEYNLTHPAIADVGTGSGCLGLSLATSLNKRQVPYTIYLSDISTEALQLAGKNADALLPSRVNLFFQQSSLMENYPKIKFDIILANLPYIPSSNIDKLDSSVKDFEPHTALDGGPKGTNLINQLLQELPNFLSDQGVAIFEIDDTQILSDFSLPSGFVGKIEEDTNSKPRFLIIRPK